MRHTTQLQYNVSNVVGNTVLSSITQVIAVAAATTTEINQIEPEP